MPEFDQELRDALQRRAEDVTDTVTAPDDLEPRIRRRRHRKVLALTTATAVVAVVVGFAGFRTVGNDDARQISAAAPSAPSEIVAQREDGAIVVLSTATGDEVRELVPSGTLGAIGPENFVVSPDGQFLYYQDASNTGSAASGADVELFMFRSASAEQIAEVEQRLTADADVASFHFVDHDESYEELRKTFAADPDLLESLDPEDLPVSFRVVATSPVAIYSLVARSSEIPGVESVHDRTATLWADIVRIPTAGGERVVVATGTNPLISPDGSTLAASSGSDDIPVPRVDLTLYTLETGEKRSVLPEEPDATGAVWPVGWAADTTLVVGGLSRGGLTQGAEGRPEVLFDRYTLDTANPNAALRPDGSLNVRYPSFATNDGTLVSSEPSPDDPAATRFVARALVGSSQPRVLGRVDFAATALDVDSTGMNVLFAGVPGAPLDDFGEPIDGVRNPDAIIGYLDTDGVVHEIGRDIFWARWIP